MGKPNEQWRDDPEGKPESTVSKAVRQTAKLASQVTKLVVKQSGLVDEETAEIVGGVADAVQNQAEAGRDASIADRLKMAGWYIGVRVSFGRRGEGFASLSLESQLSPLSITMHTTYVVHMYMQLFKDNCFLFTHKEISSRSFSDSFQEILSQFSSTRVALHKLVKRSLRFPLMKPKNKNFPWGTCP